MTQDLKPSHFVPAGGTWSGLLFNNPRIGLGTQLTWEFDFDFEELEETTPGLTIEWAPVPGVAWSDFAGVEVSCSTFADPVEASVYYHWHHRFEEAHVTVLEQDESKIRVRATVSGDLDDLGIPTLTVEAWLSFGGIGVQLNPRPGSLREATALLQEWTPVQDLAGVEQSDRYYRFTPVDS